MYTYLTIAFSNKLLRDDWVACVWLLGYLIAFDLEKYHHLVNDSVNNWIRWIVNLQQLAAGYLAV